MVKEFALNAGAIALMLTVSLPTVAMIWCLWIIARAYRLLKGDKSETCL